MKMVLICAGFQLLLLGSALQTPPPAAQEDRAAVVRRLAATTQLAAQEYRLGVVDARVVTPAEVEEAILFLREARRSASLLPVEVRSATIAQIDSVLTMVAGTASPDSVDNRVSTLTHRLADRLGITLDQVPDQPPSLARGAEVYQADCAACHGSLGRGDGLLASGLDPPPSNLADWSTLRTRSPLDYFRRISIGVAGTSMPTFEGRLSPEDRWAVALYATVLRLPAPVGEVPPALRSFGTTATMSDDAILSAADHVDASHPSARSLIAAVRTFQSDGSAAASTLVFDRVRQQLDTTYALARAGDTAAASRAFDAYMTFEQVERSIKAKNPTLAGELEAAFAALRTRAAGGATPSELDAIRGRLAAGLENAERVLGSDLSPVNLFFQSFVILLREGLEAILVVGALMTFLAKMGASHRRRDIHIGVGAAVGASLLTALALETIFVLTPAKREALEGGTMVVAAMVLFYVSYWLLSKMEVAKWNRFVRSKVQDALTSGSALALASAAFLAVYREGFETVLFYKALFVAGTGGGAAPVVGGILVGSVVLAAVYVAISRFGVRLPLKPFFAVTSAFLYYMAFVFAGKGVAELQEGSLLPTTIVSWAPRFPALGIYPTVESLTSQTVLLILLVVALAWNFVIEPRRARTFLERRSAPAPQPSTPSLPPVGVRENLELMRSLERMEADLAEIRAEVERMRRNILPAPDRSAAPPSRP